ncbi:hypothetical protein LSAT2_012658, partial [Lamellibrachia satsuma]
MKVIACCCKAKNPCARNTCSCKAANVSGTAYCDYEAVELWKNENVQLKFKKMITTLMTTKLVTMTLVTALQVNRRTAESSNEIRQ